jgi:serine O-acetyltransferase
MVKYIFRKIYKFFDVNYLATKNKKFFCVLNRIVNGCEIGDKVHIPKETFFPHGNGIVIGQGTKIGKRVIIYQNVTLGEKEGKYPKIEDNVIIYPNSIILGGIKIGKNSIIGAGSLILKDVPPNSIVFTEKKMRLKKRK